MTIILKFLKKKKISDDQELLTKLMYYRNKLEELNLEDEINKTIEYLS